MTARSAPVSAAVHGRPVARVFRLRDSGWRWRRWWRSRIPRPQHCPVAACRPCRRGSLRPDSGRTPDPRAPVPGSDAARHGHLELPGSGQAIRIGGCDRDRGGALRDRRDRHRAADGAGGGHGFIRRLCRIGQRIAVRIAEVGGDVDLVRGSARVQRRRRGDGAVSRRCPVLHDRHREPLGSGQTSRIGGSDRDRGGALRDGRDRYRAAGGPGRGHGLIRRLCRVGQRIAVGVAEVGSDVDLVRRQRSRPAAVAWGWRREPRAPGSSPPPGSAGQRSGRPNRWQ